MMIDVRANDQMIISFIWPESLFMNPDAIARFIDSWSRGDRSQDSLADTRQTERENLITLERLYRAAKDGRFEAISSCFTDDVELQIIGPAVVPFCGNWRGVTEVLDAIRKNFSQVRNQRSEIVNLTAQGSSIVVVSREQGEAISTGKPYDIHWVQILTFRDGKLCRMHEVADGLDLAVAFTG
jgi:uncharacterized protein